VLRDEADHVAETIVLTVEYLGLQSWATHSSGGLGRPLIEIQPCVGRDRPDRILTRLAV
jgi:hypothetical protein